MPIKILLGLVLCNVIWGAHAIMAKHVMESLLPFHVAWLRYTSAIIFYALLLIFFKFTGKNRELLTNKAPMTRANIIGLCAAGAISFFISPYMQFRGLIHSTATELTLLIALEPLIAAFIAWIVLRERLKGAQYISFFIALSGFFLLSKLEPTRLQETLINFNIGNLFMIASISAEATYTILSRKLSKNISPMKIFGYSLTIGWILLSVYTLINFGLPDLRSLNTTQILSLFWIGPLGTTATYIFWTIALSQVPVSAVVLTLFVQPIEGVLLGYFFLHERLSALQSIGAILILISLYSETKIAFTEKQKLDT